MKKSASSTGGVLPRLLRMARRVLGGTLPAAPDVERALREADVLAEVAGWMSATLDLSTVLGAITEAARELTVAEIALVAVEDRITHRMTFHQTAGLRGLDGRHARRARRCDRGERRPCDARRSAGEPDLLIAAGRGCDPRRARSRRGDQVHGSVAANVPAKATRTGGALTSAPSGSGW